jgi:hypothetical protein
VSPVAAVKEVMNKISCGFSGALKAIQGPNYRHSSDKKQQKTVQKTIKTSTQISSGVVLTIAAVLPTKLHCQCKTKLFPEQNEAETARNERKMHKKQFPIYRQG